MTVIRFHIKEKLQQITLFFRQLFKFKYYYYLFLLVSFIVILLSILSVSVTNHSSFCSLCHEMAPQVKGWQKSYHAKVKCVYCHVDPGFFNLLKETATTRVREIYYHFTRTYKKPINADHNLALEKIPQRRCERCHTMEKRAFSFSRHLIMDHQIHKKNKIACSFCHNRIAHGDLPGYKDFLKMTGCARCHKLKQVGQAPGTCPTCHPSKLVGTMPRPRGHRVSNWAPSSPALVVAGTISQHAKAAKRDLSYCQMCHVEQKLCTPCHGTEMPHQGPWGDRHGKTVVAVSNSENSQLFCRRCHELEKFCGKCHKGVIFPHPSPWAPIHGKLAKATNTVPCYTCHRKQFCDWCHREIKMPHIATWFREHIVFLRDNPVDKCLGCHIKTQCEGCHSKHAVHNQWTLYDFKKPLQ